MASKISGTVRRTTGCSRGDVLRLIDDQRLRASLHAAKAGISSALLARAKGPCAVRRELFHRGADPICGASGVLNVRSWFSTRTYDLVVRRSHKFESLSRCRRPGETDRRLSTQPGRSPMVSRPALHAVVLPCETRASWASSANGPSFSSQQGGHTSLSTSAGRRGGQPTLTWTGPISAVPADQLRGLASLLSRRAVSHRQVDNRFSHAAARIDCGGDGVEPAAASDSESVQSAPKSVQREMIAESAPFLEFYFCAIGSFDGRSVASDTRDASRGQNRQARRQYRSSPRH